MFNGDVSSSTGKTFYTSTINGKVLIDKYLINTTDGYNNTALYPYIVHNNVQTSVPNERYALVDLEIGDVVGYSAVSTNNIPCNHTARFLIVGIVTE